MTKKELDQKFAKAERALAVVRSKLEARWAEVDAAGGGDPGSIESVCAAEWAASEAATRDALEASRAYCQETRAETKRMKAENDLKLRAVELLEGENDRLRAKIAAYGQ